MTPQEQELVALVKELNGLVCVLEEPEGGDFIYNAPDKTISDMNHWLHEIGTYPLAHYNKETSINLGTLERWMENASENMNASYKIDPVPSFDGRHRRKSNAGSWMVELYAVDNSKEKNNRIFTTGRGPTPLHALLKALIEAVKEKNG